jgi:predicted nucleic acid-binding protein
MRCFLDANIFLRFLTGDDEKKAKECLELIRLGVAGEVELLTHPLILAEVVWVLESCYEVGRREIVRKMRQILNTPNINIRDADIFAHAVAIYAESSLDLADCFSAAMAAADDATLVSYDHDFDSLESVRRLEPAKAPVA